MAAPPQLMNYSPPTPPHNKSYVSTNFGPKNPPLSDVQMWCILFCNPPGPGPPSNIGEKLVKLKLVKLVN